MDKQDLTDTPSPDFAKILAWQNTNKELRALGLPEIPWSEAS